MVGLCNEGDVDDNSGVSRVEAYEMLKDLRVMYASQGVKIFEQKQKVGGKKIFYFCLSQICGGLVVYFPFEACFTDIS